MINAAKTSVLTIQVTFMSVFLFYKTKDFTVSNWQNGISNKKEFLNNNLKQTDLLKTRPELLK